MGAIQVAYTEISPRQESTHNAAKTAQNRSDRTLRTRRSPPNRPDLLSFSRVAGLTRLKQLSKYLTNSHFRRKVRNDATTERNAATFRPLLLVCGYSPHPHPNTHALLNSDAGNVLAPRVRRELTRTLPSSPVAAEPPHAPSAGGPGACGRPCACST